MKKLLLTNVAFAALITGPATAADLAGPVYRHPVVVAAPVYSWTGFYVGGEVGAKWTRNEWTANSLFDGPGPAPGFPALAIDATSPSNFNTTSARLGGYIGYNWQFAPLWVAGIEADVAWANRSTSQAGFPGCAILSTCVAGAVATPNGLPLGGDATSVSTRGDGSVRARLGYLITPDTLVYATGGVAFQRVEASGQCGPFFSSALCFTLDGNTVFPPITQSTTRVGWTVGAGVEQHLWANWLLRAEYRFADFGDWSNAFVFAQPAPGVGNNTYRFTLNTNTHIATVGLAYKFSYAADPVVYK